MSRSDLLARLCTRAAELWRVDPMEVLITRGHRRRGCYARQAQAAVMWCLSEHLGWSEEEIQRAFARGESSVRDNLSWAYVWQDEWRERVSEIMEVAA